ncbi:hypothetical protein [Streptomyces spongiae]|uniref:hypothetical protein n=1 Tax=Streptomyces spongiae TaxID=565072 RepID=UPI001D133EA6|nr:hypothetical protein [Streptomyces spongiae]
MSTLCDPLTDLALLVGYKRLGEQAGNESFTDSASAVSGHDLVGFGFYFALAALKLAGALKGVRARHLRKTVGPGFSRLADTPEMAIALGLTSLKEHI